jgi:putative colanic acid biosynthesis UDP-glucose lipid carrier transferase
MNEPIVFKRSASVALLTLLRSAVPAVVAVGSLLLVTAFYGANLDSQFMMMSVVVAILAPIVVQPPPMAGPQLITGHWHTAGGIVLRWFALVGLLLAIAYAAKISAEFSRRVVLTWALVTPVFLVAAIILVDAVLRRFLFGPGNARLAVFAGYNEASLALEDRLTTHGELGVRVAGFFDDRSPERLGPDAAGRILGGLAELPGYVKSEGVDVIFVALPMRNVQRVVQLLDDLHDTTASIYYVPDVFVFDLIQSRSGDILGVPVVAMCETPFHGYRGIVKRFMDVVIASLALLILSPLLLVVALLVKANSPGPAFFRQRRYGLDGAEISVWKFRTMTVMEDGDQVRQATRNDDRITRIGRFLRRTSIDELPQLFNVLQGTMSLVGPRPHAVAHNEQYRHLIKGYMIRHKVLPGITGLAQVSGCRGETAEVEQMRARIEYDLEYLRRWTPLLDLQIIWRTGLVLLRDRKAY